MSIWRILFALLLRVLLILFKFTNIFQRLLLLGLVLIILVITLLLSFKAEKLAVREFEVDLNYVEAFNKILSILQSFKSEIKEQNKDSGLIKAVVSSWPDEYSLLYSLHIEKYFVEVSVSKLDEDKCKISFSATPFFLSQSFRTNDWWSLWRGKRLLEKIDNSFA